jgi:hypothetical protein
MQMDRRTAVKAGVAATALAWTAPQIITTPADAAASCLTPAGAISWSGFSGGEPTPTANGFANYPWNIATSNGTTVSIEWVQQVAWQQFANGNAVQRTCVQKGQTGGLAAGVGYWRSDKDQAANGGVDIPNGLAGAGIFDLVFSRPVCNLVFDILDCDQNTGGGSVWTDEVTIQPLVGALLTPVLGTYTPFLGSTFITPNAAVGPATTATFTGTGGVNCGDSSNEANVTVRVRGPVDRVRITHAMQMPFPATGGDRQHIGIAAIAWS